MSLKIILKKSGREISLPQIIEDENYGDIKQKIFAFLEEEYDYYPNLCSYEIFRENIATRVIDDNEEEEDNKVNEDNDIEEIEELEFQDEEVLQENLDLTETTPEFEKEEEKTLFRNPIQNQEMVELDLNGNGNGMYSSIDIDDLSPLYFAFNSIKITEMKIYITHLFDSIPTDKLSTYLIVENQQELFSQLKHKFRNLTEQDLSMAISILFRKNVQQQDLTDDLLRYLSEIKEKRATVLKKYNIPRILKYNQQYHKTDYTNLVTLNEKGMPPFVYNNIALRIIGDNCKLTERIIKSETFFNTFELSELIPFIAVLNKGEVSVKTWNELSNVTEREVKSWLIHEKKKDGQIVFKKFRGIALRVYIPILDKYMYVNLLENGIMNCELKLDEETDIGTIISQMRMTMGDVITMINKTKIYFSARRQLDTITNSSVNIKSLDVTLDTKEDAIIHKGWTNYIVSNLLGYIFQLKQTTSEDMISFFYQNIQTVQKGGVTISIKDHPYQIGKSIFNMYALPHLSCMFIILRHISTIRDLYILEAQERGVEIEPEFQQIRKQQKIRTQKKKGAEVDSKKCQEGRRPDILDKEPVVTDSKYTIKYKGKFYQCNYTDYPFPGFTSSMVPCCFRSDRRDKIEDSKYVFSANENDIPYQPSNLVINILQDNKNYSTYVIRRIHIDDIIKYYFINEENKLVQINNEELIRKLNYQDDIWFPPTPLSRLLGLERNNNYTNKNKPDFSLRDLLDVHKVCSTKRELNYFGYNKDSTPMCFKTSELPKPVEYDNYIVKNIKNPHVLDNNRLGYLYENLHRLFNEKLNKNKENEVMYLRRGVLQNKKSFMNVFYKLASEINVMWTKEALDDVITNTLTENVFKELNGGNIANKFGTIERYKKYIYYSKKTIRWNDLVDLMTRILQVNVLLYEIPVVKKKGDADNENIQILCNWSKKIDPLLPFVILLKREDTYEIVVHLDLKTDITKSVLNLTDPIVDFTVKYHTESCVMSNQFPEEYSKFFSTERITAKYLIKKLKDTKFRIKYQIYNSFNSVNYLQLENNELLVIEESGLLPNIERKSFSDIDIESLPTISEYINFVSKINELLDDKYKYQILGYTQNSQKYVDACMTNLDFLVPVKPSKFKDDKYPLLEIKYNHNIDNVIKSGQIDETRIEYKKKVDEITSKIKQIKSHFGKIFTEPSSSNEQVTNKIRDIITSTISRTERFTQLYQILKRIFDFLVSQNKQEKIIDADDTEISFILHHITNEILNDTVDQLLLQNIVLDSDHKTESFIKREKESVLYSMDEFMKWIKDQSFEEE
jgi:hypothetical protein